MIFRIRIKFPSIIILQSLLSVKTGRFQPEIETTNQACHISGAISDFPEFSKYTQNVKNHHSLIPANLNTIS